jgi:uncharacterized protein YggE
VEERAPLLAVRGEAVLEVLPEIAYIYVTVSGRDQDRARAMNQLQERASAVDDVISRFPDAIERSETSSVSVSPSFKSTGRAVQRVVAYTATAQRTVVVKRLDRLGELTASLVDWDLSQVSGPVWALRPGSPAHRQARLEAVRDAVHRARDYAAAVGSQIRGLVELADSRLLAEAPVAPVMAQASPRALVRRREAAPEEFTFDINPVMQVVRATVEARFTMTEPDLDGAVSEGRDGEPGPGPAQTSGG